MTLVLLLPPILSLLLLGAHCMRLGMPIFLVLPIATLIMLAIPRRWIARWAQAVLILAACEWVRATLIYVSARQELGMPWVRLAFILGSVVLFTLLSALVFQSRTLRQRYRPA